MSVFTGALTGRPGGKKAEHISQQDPLPPLYLLGKDKKNNGAAAGDVSVE